MDPVASSWILEFLLRQPHVDPWVSHRLISILPVSNDCPRLRKTIILSSISSDLSQCLISEATLESLESIEELDDSVGLTIPESMQAAYAAVAVECTVKFLRCEPHDHKEFVDAVDRIWKCRISDMERSNGSVGLVSKQLMEVKEEILTAVSNHSVREELRAQDMRKEALELLRVYLEEAMEKMGPSFLEYAAAKVCGQEMEVRDSSDRSSDNACLSPSGDHVLAIPDGPDTVELNQTEENRVQPLRPDRHSGNLPVGQRDVSDLATVSSKEGMLATSEEVGAARTGNKYDCLPWSEVRKVKEALKSSSKNLQTLVEDPLPDALEMAAGILANTAAETSQKEPEENKNRVNVDAPSVEDGVDANNTGGTSTGNQNSRHAQGTSFPSLMAWNKTAQTSEWDDDSIAFPSDKSPNHSRGPRLPSPKSRDISPLKRRDITKLSKRRKIKKWSSKEEETLRQAVNEHGKGRWKLILSCYPETFEDRTEIDLKDKWRNMTRG